MGWRVALFFLEVAFSVQKATSKLLNNAFYATLCCQIKKLPWSDPAFDGGSANQSTRSNDRRRPRTSAGPSEADMQT